MDLLDNHIGRPTESASAGFQSFYYAIRGFAGVSRCLSKPALEIVHIASEEQAQHHGAPDITWISPACTQQLIERSRAFMESTRRNKIRVPDVSIARYEGQGVYGAIAANQNGRTPRTLRAW